MRVPARIPKAYDQWAAELSAKGPLPVDRAALMRLALEWAAVQRPTLVELIEPKKK